MYDVIIIGAGPSGLMTAIQISKNKKVLIIEKKDLAGRKLMLTGGGRCNITNLKSNNDFLNVTDYNKKYLYSMINNFGPKDVCDFFTQNGIYLKEEDDNQMFPVSNKASDILNVLLKKTEGIEFKYNEFVKELMIENEYKKVVTNKGEYLAKKVVIATGGTSYKKTGSSGDHMYLAKMLNQPTIPLFPAEVGIILEEQNNLAGTSLENVCVTGEKYKKIGNLIFTHTGISGTSIMQISEFLYLDNINKISIDFLNDVDDETLFDKLEHFNKEKEIHSFLISLFTKRFSTYLLKKIKIKEDIKIKQMNKNDKINLINIIKKCPFQVKEVGNIDFAYVTGGGIDMNYINTKTMESKINGCIYFVGESLDIHGPIGGYNLTLALSTGYTAGISINLNKL